MSAYYPPVAFAFSVHLTGEGSGDEAMFREVSGLNSEVEVTELREGGENRFVHHLPGRVTHTNLVLNQGLVMASSPLFNWCKQTLEGGLDQSITPRSLTISLLDQHSRPAITWQVAQAWLVKWTIGAMDAMKNEVAVEKMEFAYKSLTRVVEQKPR